jgi:hypothetical protein
MNEQLRLLYAGDPEIRTEGILDEQRNRKKRIVRLRERQHRQVG